MERHPELTLEGLIRKLGLGDWFRRYYLLPMSGAIWSCPPCEMMSFPARTLVRFFANHHLLSVTGQPQWYTVTGGAQEYVRRLIAPFAHRIRSRLRRGGGDAPPSSVMRPGRVADQRQPGRRREL